MPRLRKYCLPMAMPSGSFFRTSWKYFIAHSFTISIDSLSLCSFFSSSVSSFSWISILYFFASQRRASG